MIALIRPFYDGASMNMGLNGLRGCTESDKPISICGAWLIRSNSHLRKLFMGLCSQQLMKFCLRIYYPRAQVNRVM